VWTIPSASLTSAARTGATFDEAIVALATAAEQLQEIAASHKAAGATDESDDFLMLAVMARDPALAAAPRTAAGAGGDGLSVLISSGEPQAALLASVPDLYMGRFVPPTS
jgi:hypothetical protein